MHWRTLHTPSRSVYVVKPRCVCAVIGTLPIPPEVSGNFNSPRVLCEIAIHPRDDEYTQLPHSTSEKRCRIQTETQETNVHVHAQPSLYSEDAAAHPAAGIRTTTAKITHTRVYCPKIEWPRGIARVWEQKNRRSNPTYFIAQHDTREYPAIRPES